MSTEGRSSNTAAVFSRYVGRSRSSGSRQHSNRPRLTARPAFLAEHTPRLGPRKTETLSKVDTSVIASSVSASVDPSSQITISTERSVWAWTLATASVRTRPLSKTGITTVTRQEEVSRGSSTRSGRIEAASV